MVSFQRVDKGLGSVVGIGVGVKDWDRTIVWKEFDGLCNAFGSCQWDVDTVAAVVFEGWSEVVSVRTFAVPCPAVVGCFVDNGATGGQRKLVWLKSNTP